MAIYQIDTEDGHTYEVETEDPVSKAESFGRAAVNNLPLGGQIGALGTAALKGEDYSPAMAEWNQKAAEAKTANPVSYGAGAVTGSVAPMLIPGVGAALKAAPIAGSAILGAGYGAGNVDVLKEPGKAAEEAAIGAGIGGATAGILGKVPSGTKILTNYAERQAIPSVGIEKGVLKGTEAETQELGKFITESGLVGTKKADMLTKALEQQDAIGSTIGEIGAQANKLGLTAKPEIFQNAVQDLMGKSQEFANSGNPAAKRLAREYMGGVQDLMKKAANGDWDSLAKLKTMYGNLAFDSKHEIKSEAAKDVYFHIRDMMKSIAQDAQVNPTLPGAYKEALGNYRKIGDVVDGLQNMVAQERAGGQPHGGGAHGLARIIKSLPGQENPAINLPTAALASMIHPAAGLAVALPTLTNPAVRSMTAQAAAKAAPAVGAATKVMTTDALISHFLGNPQAYGQYAAPLHQAMQKGGKQGFAATSFVLRSQHPDLNDIMLKGSGQDETER
jgi:hypothetical protein